MRNPNVGARVGSDPKHPNSGPLKAPASSRVGPFRGAKGKLPNMEKR